MIDRINNNECDICERDMVGKRVLSFGEMLLRLAAPGFTILFQKDSLDATFCGGEANVAVSLANFGIQSSFITKLPYNELGKAAVNSLRYFGVETEKIVYGDGRMGIYFLEKGASQRPSKVIYDRKFSAISLATEDDFDWDTIFNNIDWFHWTGINPALSENMARICLLACKKAKEKGITISCDLNYRGKLWTPERAQSIMPELLKYVDICIVNEEDAEKALGIKSEGTDTNSAMICKEGYIKSAKSICKLYGCKYVATTLRKSYSASINGWSAMLYDAEIEKAFFSDEYKIQLVDRVGGGDSFAAGLIYGLCMQKSNQSVIDFATAASCLKQTMEGDYNRATVADVENLLSNGGNGRVQR